MDQNIRGSGYLKRRGLLIKRDRRKVSDRRGAVFNDARKIVRLYSLQQSLPKPNESENVVLEWESCSPFRGDSRVAAGRGKYDALLIMTT